MPHHPPRLLTIGRIAALLRVPAHRVHYVIETRNIAPSAYAGLYRLFNNEAVARVRHELIAIDACRQGGSDV